MFNAQMTSITETIAGNKETTSFLQGIASKHGLMAYANEAGKSATIGIMAGSFSGMGVPVFLTDIKGDLAGIALLGKNNVASSAGPNQGEMEKDCIGMFQTCFWDVFGEQGHPFRATVSGMGPLLLAGLLGLNDIQAAALHAIFKTADSRQWLLLDVKDLSAMVQYAGNNAKDIQTCYGGISTQSAGAIQRRLNVLVQAGAGLFFGEPALDIYDIMKTDNNGCGQVNILHGTKLIQSPPLYTAALLWFLSEVIESLPVVEDIRKPKLVLFIDEAKLFFDHMPKPVTDRIAKTIKLAGQKGIGLFFIVKSPSDLPGEVLATLGSHIQHVMPNKISVSFTDNTRKPEKVEHLFDLPPQVRPDILDGKVRERMINASLLKGKYEKIYDRESAYEMLSKLTEKATAAQQGDVCDEPHEKKKPKADKDKKTIGPIERMANSALTTIGREVGKSIVRGLLGSMKR